MGAGKCKAASTIGSQPVRTFDRLIAWQRGKGGRQEQAAGQEQTAGAGAAAGAGADGRGRSSGRGRSRRQEQTAGADDFPFLICQFSFGIP